MCVCGPEATSSSQHARPPGPYTNHSSSGLTPNGLKGPKGGKRTGICCLNNLRNTHPLPCGARARSAEEQGSCTREPTKRPSPEVKVPGGGGGLLASAGRPTHPRKFSPRKKMKFIKGAGNLRPILGTHAFWPLTPPLPPRSGGFCSLSNSLLRGQQKDTSITLSNPRASGSTWS